MTTGLVLGLMAAAAAILVAWPLIRRRATAAAQAEMRHAVFRDQLAEVERDLERGVIGPAEANAARTEIERRLLATLSQDDAQAVGSEAAATPPSRAVRAAVFCLAVTAPLAAGAFYLVMGAPHLPDQPVAQRTQEPPADPAVAEAQLRELVAKVETRLDQRPDEIEGWILLTSAYVRLGRLDDAAHAHDAAIALAQPDSERAARISISYGEALLNITNGQITPRVRTVFNEALKLDPANPAARYYDGLARLQAGEVRAALAIWMEIEDDAPPDAPWLATLRARIADLAREAGVDPRGPSPEPR